ncbi:secretin and TonB N-terminal domain-containing protein [Fibrobacter sp. UWB10]|uniref:secretin and TonB N-terminal domain-containing protein n=1 Tax=Fibrobacter sp. UWB10 TaxID=1896201 RepID=UPI002403640C|nr:secretin and TonB N-terminal domain-containing protein [Fibrobacter sp. UWB10]SMP46372.1 Type II secretory pathway component GspD/PulD (secretin) [Fibrobacter sp. UWB10]
MKFLCKFKVAVFALLVLNLPIWAQPTSLPPLPIPDSLVVKNLNVKNTEIRDLLQGLAVQYGLNLFLAPDVKGPVTVNFSNQPLKSALRVLLQGNGYEYTVDGSVIRVQKPVEKIPEAPKPPEKRFRVEWANNTLTLDVEDAPLDKLVRKVVEATGKNILLDQGISKSVSVFVQNLPFDRAMRYLAESAELDYEDDDGIVSLKKASWNLGGKGNDNSNKFKVRLISDSLLNIEAVDAPLASLLSEVLSQTKLNAMVYGKLDGSVTSHISGIPVREALKYLFRGTAYTFWERDGVYFIGPHEMQTADNSLLIKLKHLRAEDVIKLLPTTLTKSTQIQVVKSQNALMAVGSYDVLDAISQYVDKMDLPVAQILIEVLVVDMDIEKGHNHGLNLLFGKASQHMGSEMLFPNIDQTLNARQTQKIFNGIGLGDVIQVPKDLVAKIEAMEQEKILDVKARSQIATLNGEKAVLTIGQTQYYMMSSEVDYNQGDAVTSKTTQRFEQIEANSNITVTPYVTGGGEITCEIIPDFSEPEGSFSSSVPPTLNKRYVKSSVRLRDGETIVLGGMVKESVNDVHRQVPFLGSIPILGWLFRNVEQVHSKSQLLIFVTPHIYYGAEGSVDVADEIEKAKQPLVPKKKKSDKKPVKQSEDKKK